MGLVRIHEYQPLADFLEAGDDAAWLSQIRRDIREIRPLDPGKRGWIESESLRMEPEPASLLKSERNSRNPASTVPV